MRTSFVLATALGPLAILAACATTEDTTVLEGDADAATPPVTIPDAGGADVDLWDVDVPDTRLPDCSPAGWCITSLPDEDLDVRDVWPLEDVAFAIAQSLTEGVKFLEWKKSTNAWEYIDDLSQNGAGMGTFGGGVYAPNENEVYFAVGSSFVFRGTRPTPAAKWTWTHTELPDGIVDHPTTHDHSMPYSGFVREPVEAVGVWGTGADDVYAHYSNTIFRRDPASGDWSAVYSISDFGSADEHVFFLNAAGTGPDDIWFVGARDRATTSSRYLSCPLIVHKSATGWGRVVDGVVGTSSANTCTVRAGTPRLGNAFGGWVTDIQPVSATEFVALHNGRSGLSAEVVQFTRIRAADTDAGGAPFTFEQSVLPVKLANTTPVPYGPPKIMTSLWRGESETWFTAWGLISSRTDDGSLTVSTLSRDGAPGRAALHKIRGTTNLNLWAVGARHAYHKTTP